MEFRQLKTFQAVARLQSFNGAASVLNYAQSTVSTQIKLLEEEFGVALFSRLGKKICLTEAGRMLMHYSQKILDMEKETVSRISDWEEPWATISLRMPQSLATSYLPSILIQFQQEYPQVSFDVSTCAYETLIHELKVGVTDIAFLLAESVPFAELKSEVLCIEPLVIVSGPDHHLAGADSLEFAQLSGETIILPKHDCSYKMVFEEMLTAEKISPVTLMELNSVESIKQCVMKGLGVAMLPRIAVKENLDQKQLTELPFPDEGLETAVIMIWHKDKWLSPLIRSFMVTAREKIETGKR